MSDDLVKRLREKAFRAESCEMLETAADCIEDLERIIKEDTRCLSAYHKWCAMNGCAPSSSDLIAASKALEGKE